MCRNIKPLFNFDPPVTPEEVRAASLQFVRKISGFGKPSKANEVAFMAAVDEVMEASARLLASLETNSPARTREEEAAKARLRNAQRFPAKVTPGEKSSPSFLDLVCCAMRCSLFHRCLRLRARRPMREFLWLRSAGSACCR